MHRQRPATLMSALAISWAVLAHADDFRQLGAHEHGHLTLNVVVEGQEGRLMRGRLLELLAPEVL